MKFVPSFSRRGQTSAENALGGVGRPRAVSAEATLFQHVGKTLASGVIS